MLELVMMIDRGYATCRLRGQGYQRRMYTGPMSNITPHNDTGCLSSQWCPISLHTRMRNHTCGDVGGHVSSLIIQISRRWAKGKQNNNNQDSSMNHRWNPLFVFTCFGTSAKRPAYSSSYFPSHRRVYRQSQNMQWNALRCIGKTIALKIVTEAVTMPDQTVGSLDALMCWFRLHLWQDVLLEVVTVEKSTYGCYVAQQHDKQSCKQQHNRFLK